MPAAAANALKPIATRIPLMAMTAVQRLCGIAKRIPDQPKSFRRVVRDGACSVASAEVSGAGSFGEGAITAKSLVEEEFSVQSDWGAGPKASSARLLPIPTLRSFSRLLRTQDDMP